MRQNIRLTEGAAKRIRNMVHERDGNACILCGWTLGVDCHHVIFRSAGGEDTAENMVCLCRKCHQIYAHGKKQKAFQKLFLEYLSSDKCKAWNERYASELKEIYERGVK